MRDHLRGAFFRTPKTARLERDFEDMQALAGASTILSFQAAGHPPDHYKVTFRGRSLIPGPGRAQSIDLGDRQDVEIKMGIDYPRAAPQLRWLTPIVHPNIFNGTVCLGTFWNSWTPYFKLTDLVEILWDMSRLALLNPHSAGPSGTQGEVEHWKRLSVEFGFPVDRRPLADRHARPPGEKHAGGAPAPAADDVVWLEGESGCPPGGPR